MTEKTEWIRHLRDESRSLRLEAEQFLSQSKATLEESIRDIENGNNELRKKFQRKVLTDDAVEKIIGWKNKKCYVLLFFEIVAVTRNILC